MHRVRQGHWSCLPLHLGMSLGDQLGMGEGHLGALNELGDYLGILLRQKYKIAKFNCKLRVLINNCLCMHLHRKWPMVSIFKSFNLPSI